MVPRSSRADIRFKNCTTSCSSFPISIFVSSGCVFRSDSNFPTFLVSAALFGTTILDLAVISGCLFACSSFVSWRVFHFDGCSIVFMDTSFALTGFPEAGGSASCFDGESLFRIISLRDTIFFAVCSRLILLVSLEILFLIPWIIFFSAGMIFSLFAILSLISFIRAIHSSEVFDTTFSMARVRILVMALSARVPPAAHSAAPSTCPTTGIIDPRVVAHATAPETAPSLPTFSIIAL